MFSWCLDLFTHSIPLCWLIVAAIVTIVHIIHTHTLSHTVWSVYKRLMLYRLLKEIKYLLFNVYYLSNNSIHSIFREFFGNFSLFLAHSLASGLIILFIMIHTRSGDCEPYSCCAIFWADGFIISWWVESHKIDGNSTIWSSSDLYLTRKRLWL